MNKEIREQKIFHLINLMGYKTTDAEECFQTAMDQIKGVTEENREQVEKAVRLGVDFGHMILMEFKTRLVQAYEEMLDDDDVGTLIDLFESPLGTKLRDLNVKLTEIVNSMYDLEPPD